MVDGSRVRRSDVSGDVDPPGRVLVETSLRSPGTICASSERSSAAWPIVIERGLSAVRPGIDSRFALRLTCGPPRQAHDHQQKSDHGAMTRPNRLYVIHQYSRDVPIPGGSLLMSSGCYLVQTDDGRNIMIDSGMPVDTSLQGPAVDDSPEILSQLGGLGVRPDDVEMVICTHYDIDHVGRHERFTNAEFVVQREHHELAASGAERFASGRAHWDPPGVQRRLIEGDVELLPGLRLVETSGHAPGHQSVLVTLPVTGPVLLAADAVSMQRQFTADRQAYSYEEVDRLRASTRKLLDIVSREKVAFTVFHHDGGQWKNLRRAPKFYE
jgi:N-acyl homoserine lactone hydrolase